MSDYKRQTMIFGLSETERKALLLGGATIALLLMFPKLAGAVAQSASQSIVEGAGGVITGSVIGAGEVIGIPETDKTQCQQDIEAGRTWDASFSCPAPDFLRYVF